MRTISSAALAVTLLSAPLSAQLEAAHLPFADATEAFEAAARSGKRVLVYQDWPG